MAKSRASETTPEVQCYNALQVAMEALGIHKPNDGSEYDRRYAVTVTELEKVFAYFNTFVVVPLRVASNDSQ